MSSFTYASAFNLSEKSHPFNPTIASSSSAFDDDDTDDACSICLEPFTLQDPATVTSCKHEYHLQCIIEWSQRSKECPICWQFFVLKDPLSQELLAAVDKERMKTTRNVRSPSSPRIIGHSAEDDFHSEEEEESSFDEQFLRLLTQAAHRRSSLRSTETPIPFNDPAPTDMDHISAAVISHVEHQNANPPSSPASPAVTTNGSRISPGPAPSEASSLPEAIKSKLAAASARYKESISKSKQGLKEKLLARNNSVKELSKGVQREMNAGIAGVARMMERLDIASKRFGGGSTTSGFNFSFKGKREDEATSNNGNKNRIP